MGLFSSSSKSASSSVTENLDKRIVADGGSGVVSADRSNLFDTGGSPALNLVVGQGQGKKASSSAVVNITDGGAVRSALEFASRAVDTVAGEGLDKILTLAGDLFDGAQAANESAISAVQSAYAQADSDKQGAIDNRTMIVLAVVAAVALFFVMGKK